MEGAVSKSELRGPALTYVTDEAVDRAGQERILNEFLSHAGVHPLRVAFRLPRWTDKDVHKLIDWYSLRVESLGLQEEVEPPLVHDRPESVERFPTTSLWLPWRNRDLIGPNDIGRAAISVHSLRDAHEAVSVGAVELMFGHVFSSESHPGQPGRGVAALVEMTESMQSYENPPRVTAIGGVGEHTIPELGRVAHHSIASMRSISRSADIPQTLDRIRSGWVAARINAGLDENQRVPFGNPSSIFF